MNVRQGLASEQRLQRTLAAEWFGLFTEPFGRHYQQGMILVEHGCVMVEIIHEQFLDGLIVAGFWHHIVARQDSVSVGVDNEGGMFACV